jgi:hypothetical protein
LNINYLLTENTDLFRTNTLDLEDLISYLKSNELWEKRELNSMILLKSLRKSIVLTSIHDGIEIVSYQANDKLLLNILTGRISVHLKNKCISLQEGNTFTLRENINYRITTDVDAIFLLQTETFPISERKWLWPNTQMKQHISMRLQHFYNGICNVLC